MELELDEGVARFMQQHNRCPFTKPLDAPGMEYRVLFWDGEGYWIPRNRNSEQPNRQNRFLKAKPYWGNDYPPLYSLDELEDLIDLCGSTGWNWRKRESKWFGFDFDLKTENEHSDGCTPEQLNEVIGALRALDYVNVRRSKSGRGVHAIVIRDAPARTGKIHKQNASAMLAAMTRDAGFPFSQYVCQVGGIMYSYKRQENDTI